MNTIFAFLFCATCYAVDTPDIQQHEDGYIITEEGLRGLWTHIETVEKQNERLYEFIDEQEETIDHLEVEVQRLERRNTFLTITTLTATGAIIGSAIIIFLQ